MPSGLWIQSFATPHWEHYKNNSMRKKNKRTYFFRSIIRQLLWTRISIIKENILIYAVVSWTSSHNCRNTIFLPLTNIQKKYAISKAFWNRMKWIKKMTICGLWNQKRWSDGVTTKSPSMAECFSATSWANWVIICSNFVPMASRSCSTTRYIQ